MPKYDGVEAKYARVIQHILVSGAFRAAVGSLEIEWRRFLNAVGPIGRRVAQSLFLEAHSFEFAIDLIARRVKDRRLELPLTHALQNIDGAQNVGFEVAPVVINRRG